MGFLQSYKPVFDEVRAKLQAVASIKTVLTGEAFRPGELPMALIIPREALGERTAMNRILEYRVAWDVVILIRETEPENWFDEVIPILCDAYDAVMADDTLNGKAVAVTPIQLSPGEITAGNKLYYGGLIKFQAIIRHMY